MRILKVTYIKYNICIYIYIYPHISTLDWNHWNHFTFFELKFASHSTWNGKQWHCFARGQRDRVSGWQWHYSEGLVGSGFRICTVKLFRTSDTTVWKRLTKLAFRRSFFSHIWQTFSILFLYPLCKSSDLWGFSPVLLDILWRHGMGRPEKDPGIQQSHGTKVGNQTIEPY